jgi:hypothetical protein
VSAEPPANFNIERGHPRCRVADGLGPSSNVAGSVQTVAANSSVTAPFARMLVEGAWDPVRTTGSAVGLPSLWPFRVFWQEP